MRCASPRGTNFREFCTGEVRRRPLLRTWVNRGIRKGRSLGTFDPSSSLRKLRQTFEEALRKGFEELIFRAGADEHPLAVGCERIVPVGEHPVEATAACDHVLARRTVPGNDPVVAWTAGDSVLLGVGLVAVNQEVVTLCAHYNVRASGADKCIVAVSACQVLIACSGGISKSAENQIFACSAQ